MKLYTKQNYCHSEVSQLKIRNNGDLREIQGLCSKMTPLHTEEGFGGQIQYLGKSQSMTSYKLFSHSEP